MVVIIDLIFMPKKVRSERCSGGWCKNHLLQMLPLKNSECYYRKKMKLRFCPKHNPKTKEFNNIMPIVNRDRKHYTPCFILEEEHNYYKDNDERLLYNHNLKLQPSEEATILIAKHGRKKNYCSVCKAEYEDYLEHIDDSSHRNNLRNNKFSRYILETEQEMGKEVEKIQSKKDFMMPMDTNTKLMEQTKDRQICGE